MGYCAVLETRIIAVDDYVAGDGQDDDEHHRVHHDTSADGEDEGSNRSSRVDAIVQRQDGQLGQRRR